ncbi:MAG: multiheme c-type cytochrome [Bacteroidia bacterium]|nr:multiheme c-type cytochrome [Bacteroidia bacterium]
MRSGIIITTSIIAIILSRGINHNSVYLYQSGTFLEQSEFQLSGGKNSSIQEKTRYLYVGAKTCVGKCHNNTATGYQYNIWKRSSHSKSYIHLTSEKALRYSKRANIKENPQESATCLKCHITGSGLDSSSYGDTYSKEEGITCEACHKGEFITKSFLPKETDCLRCHNDSVHKTSKFDFNGKYAKIAHPKPKAKLKKA